MGGLKPPPSWDTPDAFAQSVPYPLAGEWPYKYADGSTALLLLRFTTHPLRGGSIPGKTFRPLHPRDGRWFLGDPPPPLPLYRLPQLLASTDRVFVVEGEKCAERLAQIGFTATTSAHGALSPRKTDWSPLTGREVIILPDNDPPGQTYASAVARILREPGSKAESVAIIDLPDLPPGGDIADFLDAAGPTTDKPKYLNRTLAKATPRLATFSGPQGAAASPPKWGAAAAAPIGEVAAAVLALFPDPRPLSELGPGPSINWVWQGLLAPRFTTLLSGFPKAGKTSLVAHVLKAMALGGAVGLPVRPGRALIVSEESAGLWARRRDTIGLQDHIFLTTRLFKARPSMDEWAAFCKHIAAKVSVSTVSTVVIDTWSALSPVADENDANTNIQALGALNAITDAGAGVLLIHHLRKSDGAEGRAARGSGALAASVDIILELRRFDPADPDNPCRILAVFSRFDESQRDLHLELTDDGYTHAAGHRRRPRAAPPPSLRFEPLIAILKAAGTPLTLADIVRLWPPDLPRPHDRPLRTNLADGTSRGIFVRTGLGRAGEPFLFTLPPATAQTPGDPPAGSGGAEPAGPRPGGDFDPDTDDPAAADGQDLPADSDNPLFDFPPF